MDQSTLWLQYLNQLSSLVQLQAGEALQVTYPYTPWNWGGKNPIFGSYDYNQWATLNVVPSDPELNSNSSASSGQSGFDASYQAWFNALAIGDLATDSHYQALQTQLTTSENKYAQDYANVKNVWLNQTGGTGVAFSAWLADPAQFSYATTISEDAADVKGLQQELDTYRAQIQQPLSQVTADFANPAFNANVTDPNTGASFPARLWDTTSYANAWAYIQAVVGTFGQDASNGSKASFSMVSDSSQYNYSEFYAEGGTGAWDDFIGFEAEGSYQKIDWSQFSSDYEISFTFQDLQTVPVAAAGWYKGAYIGDFGNGPYATGFSAFPSGNNNYFFGPGGALSRIYTGLIVGYRPTVTISASQAFSTYLQDKWQAEGGLEIGPFFFGSEASGEDSSSTVSVQGSSLALQSTADWPLIVAMKSAWTKSPNPQAAALAERAPSAGPGAQVTVPSGTPFVDQATLQRLNLGAVQNMAPGGVIEVAAGAIPRNVHLYRTGQGDPGPGHVGWAPQVGNQQMQDLAVGGTATFAINGAAGMLVNVCPSMVQALW